jgi:hypothetical protein
VKKWWVTINPRENDVNGNFRFFISPVEVLSSHFLKGTSMSTLNKAIEIAARAHAERIGEDGEPEILHPIRVMLRLHPDDERQVAMLHDVMEDCGLTAEDLHAAGFATHVVAAVEVLTGRAGETYEQYIKRVIELPLAVRVKQADIEEHASVVRRLPVSAEQLERLGNYQRARAVLAATSS